MIKNILYILLGIILIAVIIFFVGAKPSYSKVNNVPSTRTFDISQLDAVIAAQEDKVTDIKEDNQARIVWADSSHQKTPFSLVYIHGFSASQGEGFPIHTNTADSLGANLYLPRLHGHGIEDDNAMHDLTPEILVEEAKEAIAIGKTLGDEVIVMGCSTGATLAIYLAANDPEIAAIVLLSPNIELKSSAAKLLTGPWGKKLAFKLMGAKRANDSEGYKQYWSNSYSTNGLIALQALLDQTMKKEVFEKIMSPVYCGYYYKNEEEQDPVVSVAAMFEFKEDLIVPADDIEFEAFPEAGDHVISTSYKNDNWLKVQTEVLDFLHREVVGSE